MYVYCKHACCPQRPEDEIEFPGTGVAGGCEPVCKYWDLSQGPLQSMEGSQLLSHLSSLAFVLKLRGLCLISSPGHVELLIGLISKLHLDKFSVLPERDSW